jgi:hypothetical protein
MGNGCLIRLEGFVSLDIWVCEGYCPVGLVSKRFRTMTVIRPFQSKELILINPIRLDLETEKELRKLGTVTHIIRQSSHNAGFDDRYYVEQFSARAYAYLFVASKDKQAPWSLQGWQMFDIGNVPECLSHVGMEVLDVPIGNGKAECVFYLPKDRCLIVADFMQNNDFDRKKFYGMTLSNLRISRFSQTMLSFNGYGGHLQTPRSYLENCESVNDIYVFQGEVMDKDWDRVLCHYGGPSLQSAKRIRKDFIHDWPGVAFGKHTQLSLA